MSLSSWTHLTLETKTVNQSDYVECPVIEPGDSHVTAYEFAAHHIIVHEFAIP